MAKTYKPGEVAPCPGVYEIVGPRGGRTGDERTIPEGRKLPPTPKPDEEYRLARRTHNRTGCKR
jgi:hypothetical protein